VSGENDNVRASGTEPRLQVNDQPIISINGRRRRRVISKAVTASRYVFAYFTIHLVLIQFTAHGLHVYFSLYVSREWWFSGYVLYAALIYLFAVYLVALLDKGLYLTGFLQLISLCILVGIMIYPFYSIDHVSLLPLLAGLQPMILFSDHRSTSVGGIQGTLWGSFLILVLLTPIIVVLMVFPIPEKIIIYCCTALLFARLQQWGIRSGNTERRDYIAG
jgi:hypothetical protein